ncbi:MAG: PAP/fibrillin family protein [Pseudomonadota bacterium]
MTDLNLLKENVLSAIALSSEDGTYSDEAYDKVQAAIQSLVPHSPTPRPIDEQEFVSSAWGTLYAQFGPRHTAGKPIEHVSNLKILSWAKFPEIPIFMRRLEQEIDHNTRAYNNIHYVTPVDGGMEAAYRVFGEYALDGDEPQRYKVNFYKGDFIGLNGESPEGIRAAFGMDPDQPLEVELQSPKLHSDVVYVDGDMRINYGSVGGVYVLNRLTSPMQSV